MVLLRCRPLSQAVNPYIFSPRLCPIAPYLSSNGHSRSARRCFSQSPIPWGIRSQVLKDVGEGITEVQIIQWYVQEGARIEEWKPLCQYQSDKAVDDITSRYEGVIKKLHFQTDDTVPTGMALCDIEVDDAMYPDNNAPVPAPTPEAPAENQPEVSATPEPLQQIDLTAIQQPAAPAPVATNPEPPAPKSKYASLATPAVRGMLKQHSLEIESITGTGKDGRVMKDDVLRHVAQRDSQAAAASAVPTAPFPTAAPASVNTAQTETTTPLTPIQSQMFKTMTRSLSIPHFLYADELDIGVLSEVRKRLSTSLSPEQKLSYLPFVIKAVSLSLAQYPTLNARVDTTTNPSKPALVMRSNHNIGIAMDTPIGLLVPNIKNVQARSILDIASELRRLSEVARAGKLTPSDLSGGTITVSNIGTLGGTYVAPVIVSSEVAILGIGKARTVPVFDDEGNVVKGQRVNFSWSADHRVVDGATMARMAENVREYLEVPEKMMIVLR
ncbi:hypothetical protein AJ80_05272 [Polytolypa hystricis UAMH7299]|uniref:Dihydrolipoamide acetyltransferase component of pyruvate dehydrogenase complex n=1 Tax=Polytolypa hystricis (strain UAMH7299) TaxID=1447883 RepID=A0A2B7Y545_POLH7|nr:hypothetical protein AJ80_05272 [Polytolypa hystricis UAMH7299]